MLDSLATSIHLHARETVSKWKIKTFVKLKLLDECYLKVFETKPTLRGKFFLNKNESQLC